MTPVTPILSSETFNAIIVGIAAVGSLINAVNKAKKKDYENNRFKVEFQAKQIEETRQFQLEANRFQLEAEQTRFNNALELRKVLKNNEITPETFIALTQENASNIKAIVNDTSKTATELSKLVTIDKNLNLSVDKQNLANNDKSLALYADINDSGNEEFHLMESMGKHQILPKEQYLIGVDETLRAEQTKSIQPEQAPTAVEPVKPFKPRSRRGLPFASASLSRNSIGIQEAGLYNKGNGEEMHLAVPPSKSPWELETRSSNDIVPLIFSIVILFVALMQYFHTRLNRIQSQMNP